MAQDGQLYAMELQGKALCIVQAASGGLARTATLTLGAVTVALSPQASGWTLGSQRTSLRACACTCRRCGPSTPRSCTRGLVL